MKDTIQEDDMLVDITRTEIEKELERTRKENSILQDKMKVLEEQMSKIVSVTDQLFGQIKRNAQKKETRDIELNLSEVSVMPLGKKPSRI
jgi:phosphoribosyl-dephospho-CoA transferase